MNSIEAMEVEIGNQVQELPKSVQQNKINPNRCLFIGSGDSFIAGLVAHHASKLRVISCNPVEFLLNPCIANKRHMYIISVSGRTNANILSAVVARKHKIRTTAITTKPESILAKYCDNCIKLSYKSTGSLTPGTIGFTSTMLSCLSLITDVPNLDNIGSIYQQANIEAENLIKKHCIDTSSFIFLGDGISFPISMYGALKVNEIFGSKSYAYSIEEFCHSPIFSIKPGDNIVILDYFGYDKNNARLLYKRLNHINYPSLYIDLSGPSVTEALLKSIFLIQMLLLKLAKRDGLQECFFLSNKELLKLSSDLIYMPSSQDLDKL
jgi:glucosamine 6-phosphate synthetase-like amidotransferase/phosphosugar isomerase protein